MSSKILIPDLGGVTEAEVVEILVQVSDLIHKDQSILVLEGEKSTVEIPSPSNGIVKNIKCKVGDKLSSGQEVMEIAEEETPNSEVLTDKPIKKSTVDIVLPDVGVTTGIRVIEVLINSGDIVNENDSILTLESEKASMDVPAPYAGKIVEVIVAKNSEVQQGSLLARIEITPKENSTVPIPIAEEAPTGDTATLVPGSSTTVEEFIHRSNVHASPSVRRIAREFGVDLAKVKGTGRKERIILVDVQNYVKSKLKDQKQGINIPALLAVDHEKFGQVEYQELARVKQLTGEHVYKSWINIPHVTHFDEADITELEKYRKQRNSSLSKNGVKLTPLVFIMKAVADCLKEFPSFNASLGEDRKELILKKYFNIGIAVDTDKGLVVPVIKNVDKKDINELSKELLNISNKAREKGLTVDEMSGSSFTISSLGGIGGTGFTPIVNVPNVAILGISKAKMQPIYIDGDFKPRLILPFSLSYDHRVIDGAEAARFCKNLSAKLANIDYMI